MRTRRQFIKDVGCVTVGFSLMGSAGPLLQCADESTLVNDDYPLKAVDESRIDAWLQILEDGRIRVLTGRMELGQGVRIAMAQVAAEELNTDIDMVEVNLAETGVTPDEGVTAGSRSMERGAMSVRRAAASAREELLGIAAKNWEVPKKDLVVENGMISAGDRSIGFRELMNGRQIEVSIKNNVPEYGKTRRNWVGKPVKRRDISDMVQGTHQFVQDLEFPDMVHARIIRPETYTSKLKSIDIKDLQKSEGFLKLVRNGSFIGVITEHEYQAIKLKEMARSLASWSTSDSLPNSAELKEYLKSLPTDNSTEESKGSIQTAFNGSSFSHEAEYFKPYIMHAANGPSCAVAHFENGKLKVWSHTQGVYPLRETLASLLKLNSDDVYVKGVPGSGCYGHNAADDVAAEAALLASEYPGRYVRLQWMRDDEHGWEPYGSAMIMNCKAGVDTEGKIITWEYDLWSDGHSTRPRGNPENFLPASFIENPYNRPGMGYKGGAVRNSTPYYSIPNIKTSSHIFKGPLRVSALRGLGAYANIFAIESFIDELAIRSEIHPLEFRIRNLDDPRAIECLQRLNDMTSSVTTSGSEGIGYAFSRYKNSAAYCAMAVHLRINPEDGHIDLVKMWAVIDAGECINLDGLKNQTEGGMIQSASWTLLEEVTFNELHVNSLDWESYPILRFPQTPQTEVEVIDRPSEPPLGAGEAAQGPAAAAVVNAIYNAVGVRIRELPVREKSLIT